jgi:predicted RNA-binding protein with PIN domain
VLFVDGHNLIGRAPGLSLSREAEAREKLLQRIGARRGNKDETVVVVFDGDRPGSAKESRFGAVHVVYAPAGRTADEEILRRLGSGNPRGATVVTSDRQLAGRALGLGARVESCESFLHRLGGRRRSAGSEKPEVVPGEVEEWLRAFSKEHKI